MKWIISTILTNSDGEQRFFYEEYFTRWEFDQAYMRLATCYDDTIHWRQEKI